MSYNTETTKALLKKARFKGEIILNIVSVILNFLINILLVYASYNLQRNPKIAEIISEFTDIDLQFIIFLSTFSGYIIVVLLTGVFVLILYYNCSYKTMAELLNFSLDDMQNKEYFELFKKYCELLDIKTPILFLNNSVYDSSIFNVKIRGEKAIGISTKAYQEAALYKDYHLFNYQVCSTLGDIYLGHYNVVFQLLTFWPKVIPFYKRLYSRTLCYSTDRVAQILIGTTPLITSIARETSGMSFLKDELVKNIINSKKEMTPAEKTVAILHNINCEYPLPFFRMKNIFENDAEDRKLYGVLNENTKKST